MNLTKFLKICYAELLQMAGCGFCTLLYVSLHASFHQAEQLERKLFFECTEQNFNIRELSPKETIRFENATFRYIFFTRTGFEIIH